MRITKLEVDGAFVIEGDRRSDDRGSFARLFDRVALAEVGADLSVHQLAGAANARAGTLRGLHLQRAPHSEDKLVWCTRGRAFDVVADLRPDSPSYRRWAAVELSARSDMAVYAPPGVAHGYLTLEDHTDLLYLIGADHRPDAEMGVRWNDPDLAVRWPDDPVVMSDRDRGLPGLAELGLA